MVLGSNRKPLSRTAANQKRAEASVQLQERWSEQAVKEAQAAERSFADVLTEWLDRGLTNRRGTPWQPKTAHENRREVAYRIRPALGHYKITEITPAVLERLYDKWAEGGGPNGRPLSDMTVNRISKMIGTALEFAKRRGYIRENPAVLAVAPSAIKQSGKLIVPTPEQIRRLIDAADRYGYSMKAAIAL